MPAGCITFYDMTVDIIIPIVAALLGGGLTMWGVAWTLKAQKKERDEDARLAVKPVFYRLHPMQDYEYKDAQEFAMCCSENPTWKVYAIIKNTENGILILDRLETANNVYYPHHGSVIEKNTVINLHIGLVDGDTMEGATFHVKDVLGNEYVYAVTTTTHSDGKSIEISGYTEIPHYNKKKRKAKK